MKEFIEYIVKQLVDKPDDVHVGETVGERTVVFEISVGDGDMGKVIGKHGQTAQSLRILVAAAAAKQGKRAVLEIVEPNGAEHKSSRYENNARHTPDHQTHGSDSHWQDEKNRHDEFRRH